MDLSRFKKVASTKTHTVFQNEDGHQIHVAHKAVDEKTKGKLKGLPQGLQVKHAVPQHFDQGGQSQPQPPSNPISEGFKGATGQQGIASAWANLTGAQKKADGGNINPPQPGEAGAQPYNPGDASDFWTFLSKNRGAPTGNQPMNYMPGSDNFPTPGQSSSGPTPASATEGPTNYQLPATPQQPSMGKDPYGYDAEANNLQAGYNKQMAGISAQATAEGQLGKQEATQYGQQASQMQDLQGEYQNQLKDLSDEHNNLVSDLQNSHIDPNHYMNNMSTGQRVMTTLGFLIGGLGAPGNHGVNAGVAQVQKDIDRDIEAQKSELGKKENLLNANMKQYGNLRDATDMQKSMSLTIAAAKVKQLEATAQDPLSKARAQQLAGALQMQSASMLQQVAMRRSVLKGMGTGAIDPAQAVSVMVPKEHQAEALKELAQTQNARQAEGNIMQNWDQANKDNTLGNRTLHGGFEPASIKNLRALALPLIHDQEGRVNEFEQKTIEDLMPSPGDAASKIAAKRAGMLQFIRSKQATPTLDSYGIQVNKPHGAGARPLAAPSNYKR